MFCDHFTDCCASITEVAFLMHSRRIARVQEIANFEQRGRFFLSDFFAKRLNYKGVFDLLLEFLVDNHRTDVHIILKHLSAVNIECR